jgi:hypothetical protein
MTEMSTLTKARRLTYLYTLKHHRPPTHIVVDSTTLEEIRQINKENFFAYTYGETGDEYLGLKVCLLMKRDVKSRVMEVL